MAAHASGFGCTTTRRSRSPGCWDTAPSASATWTSTRTTATACAAFYADPRVLTISLHQHPEILFPFTGLPAETGGPGAEGSSVNLALPAGTGDASWLRAFHAIVPTLLRQFRPQILVSQHGCDTHRLDPLAHLELSIDGQRAAHAATTRSPTTWPAGAGCSPAAAGMSWSGSCR